MSGWWWNKGRTQGPLRETLRRSGNRISRGAYWIRVSNGTYVKAKKLIIH